jgi:hypothetical protein
MYNVPPTPGQPSPSRARRIWRGVNIAVLLFGMSQDWVTACSGGEPLTGFDLALGGTLAGLLQVSIPLLILLVYCLINLAIVIWGRPERTRWLLGLITVSTLWIALLLALLDEGIEDILYGFWITMLLDHHGGRALEPGARASEAETKALA